MDGALGEITPLLQILDVFSSRLARTSEEVATIVSTSDLSFVQNLSEVEKMELWVYVLGVIKLKILQKCI